MADVVVNKGYDIHGHKFRDVSVVFKKVQIIISIDYKDDTIRVQTGHIGNLNLAVEMKFTEFLEALGLKDATSG
jgi:hypothetical protein